MTNTRKTENGITYRLKKRDQASIAEGIYYWEGSDGSILELTEEEQAERDTSRSLTDR